MLDLTEALRALADAWDAEAEDDETWSNGPRATGREVVEGWATAELGRRHAAELRALLAGKEPADA